MRYKIQYPGGPLHPKIKLEGSKSISNRLLVIRALSEQRFDIDNLSPSDDSTTLDRLLRIAESQSAASLKGAEFDAGAAGTSFRFMTAYLSLRHRDCILTGSERMKQRPIGLLVEALVTLGASISYLEEEGYPPLRIKGESLRGGKVQIPADVSSQFLSALLMIAPKLQGGLHLDLVGNVSSRPYLEMTLKLMHAFGVQSRWEGRQIIVDQQNYQSRSFTVEGDWSAASYYFSMLAIAGVIDSESDIYIKGLQEKSHQGDSILPRLYDKLGVQTKFTEKGIHLTYTGKHVDHLSWDFYDCPDLAQTVAVTCAALGISAEFSGLKSLAIKETDRTAALSNELKKFGVNFYKKENSWQLEGKIEFPEIEVLVETYKDHRMAMAFAPLGVIGKLIIDDPLVVSKSYPSFWDDLKRCGFQIEEMPFSRHF